MNKYNNEADRLAAIERGETTRRDSTLQDGVKHYAVVRYFGITREVATNLTGSPYDDRPWAERWAAIRNHNPDNAGFSYGAERIA